MTGGVRIKSVTLPVEHGGWGFLFEPILLALPVAFGLSGACLAIAAVATFLLRHPLKIALKGSGALAASPRKRIAAIVSGAYGGMALAGLAGVVALGGFAPLIPLMVLSPFAAVYFFYDARRQSRQLIAEIAGPVALAGVAVGIAIAGQWKWEAAWSLWLILMSRTVPSIFYVRARLRLERGQAVNRLFIFGIHLVFGIVVGVLVWLGLAPWLALAAFAVLWLRAWKGLSRFRRPSKAIRIGFLEIGYGLFYVAVIAVGFLFDI